MKAEDESTSATNSMRFEQSPSPVQKRDGMLRGDLAIVALICICLVVLAIASTSRDTQPAPALPTVEKSVDAQIQEMMSEAMRSYPYLNTDQGLEATREIIATRNQFLNQGIPPIEALRMAIQEIAPKYAPSQTSF